VSTRRGHSKAGSLFDPQSAFNLCTPDHSHDVAARAVGRHEELGLPLLLAAGCHLHPAGFNHLGYYDEARAWRDWLVRAVAGSPRFLLNTGTLCVLGRYGEIPAVGIWNAPLIC
jgi:hypothetical protein